MLAMLEFQLSVVESIVDVFLAENTKILSHREEESEGAASSWLSPSLEGMKNMAMNNISKKKVPISVA